MLETTPENRYTIKEVMKSRWISQYINVPQTPLPTTKIFQEDLEQLPEIKNVMSIALNEMRVNYDNRVQLKEVNESKNPMLARREAKAKKNKLPQLEEVSLGETKTIKISNDDEFQTPMNLSRTETPL